MSKRRKKKPQQTPQPKQTQQPSPVTEDLQLPEFFQAEAPDQPELAAEDVAELISETPPLDPSTVLAEEEISAAREAMAKAAAEAAAEVKERIFAEAAAPATADFPAVETSAPAGPVLEPASLETGFVEPPAPMAALVSEQLAGWKAERQEQPHPAEADNPVILRTVVKRLIYLILIFAFYLFWTGHNAPGGGFIAGLMTAAAIVLLYVCYGARFVDTTLRFDFKYLLGIGLVCSMGCGLGGVILGYPFLTHAFGHFHLPLLGEFELATATIFDLGVYLVVTGGCTTIITGIGQSRKPEAVLEPEPPREQAEI